MGERCTATNGCTGFFFQRHGNGHEICGFYNSNMHGPGTKWVSHGHAAGSQICEVNKVKILPVAQPPVWAVDGCTTEGNWGTLKDHGEQCQAPTTGTNAVRCCSKDGRQC